MKSTFTILALVAIAAMVGVTVAFVPVDDDEKVTINQVPAAVKATILKYTAGGTIKEIEKEKEKGKVIYSVEFMKGGKALEFEVAADGKFLGWEKDDDDGDDDADGDDDDDGEKPIKLAEAPQAVQAAIRKAAGNNELTELSKESDDGFTVYEAEWKVAGVEHSITLAASGEVIEYEQAIPATGLPQMVQDVLKKKFPGAKIVEAESCKVHYYEVELKTKDGKEVEVKVLASGQMGHCDDDDDDDDDEKDDD